MSYPWLVLQPTGITATDEWIRMGFASHAAGNFQLADSQYAKALALEPNHPIATNNLGLARMMAGGPMVHFGLLDLGRAVLFAPEHPVIRANYAFALLASERPTEAMQEAYIALRLAHPNPGPHPIEDAVDRAGYILSRQALANALSSTGRPDAAAPLHAQVLALNATNFGSGIALCFLGSLRDQGPEQLLPPRAAWRAANGYKGQPWPHTNKPDPDRPLRVGYVSGDFKTHSAAFIFANVCLNHDPAQVVPYFYSTHQANPDTDEMCYRLMESAGRVKMHPDDGPPIMIEEGHRWRDITAVNDVEADKLIRNDEIDILVDLSGHSHANRLSMFSRKPAPVQVTAWGFALGTGLPEIDAFFADPVVVKDEEREHFAEKVVYLPCVVTYRAPAEYGFKGDSPLPYYSNECITFGCFGRFEKMSDSYLRAVREILMRVPNSRAFFKGGEFRRPDCIRRVRDVLVNIEPDRLWFGMASGHVDHIRAYQKCDLMLDTFPHGMGQTALECLYMGVPAVTLYGRNVAGRLAASIFTCMNRTEWITRTVPEYIDKAVAMANDLPALAAVRKTLRSELMESPVVKGYPQAVESAYRSLWRQWCARQDNANVSLPSGSSGNGEAHSSVHPGARSEVAAIVGASI